MFNTHKFSVKILVLTIVGLFFLSAVTSCKKENTCRFCGTWGEEIAATGNITYYLKFTSNSSFQFIIDSTLIGDATYLIGDGTYTYTDSVITFNFVHSYDGYNLCLGVPAIRPYTITTYKDAGPNGAVATDYFLNFGASTDTCSANTQLPRASIIWGSMIKM